MEINEDLEQIGEPIDLAEIKSIVRRRRWHFLVPFFLGWLVVFAGIWLIPPTYRSGTLILVEQPSMPEKLVASNVDNDVQHQLDSLTEQILSRTRLLGIINHLGLYANERKHKRDDDLVEKMRKDIEIELSHGDDRKLSAFNIYYSSRDPKTAQVTTNELANLFIARDFEERQKRSEDQTSFLEEELEQARLKLAAQEMKMRQFKDQHLGELPTQTQSNLTILSGLQSSLVANEDALNRAKQQNTYLESLVNQFRTMSAGGKADQGGEPGLADIDKQLDQLRAQLVDLRSHYTEKYPDVRKTKEQIAQLESTRKRLVADANNAANNPAPVTPAAAQPIETKTAAQLEIESQLKANRLEIASREMQIKESEAKINEYQARLNLAPVMEQQFSEITRDYDQSKADYESLMTKKNESERTKNLEKTEQAEHFRMLDPPNLPAHPYKPNRLLLSGVAVVVGLIFGAAFVLIPVDVIAEIPPIESLEEQAMGRRRAWKAGIAAVAVFGVILLSSAATYLYG
jgi:polysaccharide chain length determinant protein (PEP-CTERM system associated)